MRIRHVELRNFRSFAQFDLDLGGRSVFVIGENGGGKTSLMTAIARALGRDLNFSSADFANLDESVELRITLTDLDVQQQGIFGNYVDFGGGPPVLRMETRALWNAAADEAETEHGYPRQPGSRSRRDERDAIPLQWLPSNRFLTNGGDVFSLQRILGHSPASLDITQRYVELLDEDLREVHRRASPMDQWRSG